MIKSQRFLPFLSKTLQKPPLPLTFISHLPSHPFPKGLAFYPFANFSTQNVLEKAPEKSNKAIIEGWGTKVILSKGQKRYWRRMLLPDYCVKVALRVIDTCLIYADSTQKELAKLTEGSRFYYVKKKFDEMGKEDAAEFVKFLKEKDEVAIKILREKLRMRGIEESELQGSTFSQMLVGEKDNQSFIDTLLQRNPRYRAIVGDLLMEFLDPENPDFKSFLMIRDEEKRIGKLTPPGRPYKKLKIMAEHKEELKQKFKKIIEKWEKKDPKEFETIKIKIKTKPEKKGKSEEELEKQKKPIKYFVYSAHRLLRAALTRLTYTMLIYLRAPHHVVENIPKVSRFYYVHQKLKDWSKEEKLKLWSYLHTLKGNVRVALPEGVVINKVHITIATVSAEELYYILHHKTYGKLYTELLQEFFKDDNMDQFYLYNAFEDEVDIGQFSAPPGKMDAVTKAALQNNLNECKQRLQDTIDTVCYEDLHFLIEKQRAEKSRKVLEHLRNERLLRPWKNKKKPVVKFKFESEDAEDLEGLEGSESPEGGKN